MSSVKLEAKIPGFKDLLTYMKSHCPASSDCNPRTRREEHLLEVVAAAIDLNNFSVKNHIDAQVEALRKGST